MNNKNFRVSIFRIAQRSVHKSIFSQSTPIAYQISIIFSMVFFLTIFLACSSEDRISKEDALGKDRLFGIRVDESLQRPNFILQDTDGNIFDFQQKTSGKVTLLYFGYTNCPDICPVHFANIAAALDRSPYEVRNGVNVIFVSVDPERDSPKKIREWLDFFDSDFIGLTGTDSDLVIAQNAVGAPAAFVSEVYENGYSIAHAAWIFLYTQDGSLYLKYPTGTRQAEWAHDLEALVLENWSHGSKGSKNNGG